MVDLLSSRFVDPKTEFLRFVPSAKTQNPKRFGRKGALLEQPSGLEQASGKALLNLKRAQDAVQPFGYRPVEAVRVGFERVVALEQHHLAVVCRFRAAEGVRFALHDQGGDLYARQLGCSALLRLARWVDRERQAEDRHRLAVD